MSVFISWAGKNSRSHKTALLLRDWLPKVIQKLPCFVSSHDIEAGARWATLLFDQLEKCNVGILCITHKTLEKPWIHFEAGALAKKVEQSRVCPLLLDLTTADVGFPLAAFQLKTTSKEDMKSLLVMINAAREAEALLPTDLEEAFEYRWPQFAVDLEQIAPDANESKSPPSETKEQKALGEVLELVRGMASGRIGVSATLAMPKDAPMSEVKAQLGWSTMRIKNYSAAEKAARAEYESMRVGLSMLNELCRKAQSTGKPLLPVFIVQCEQGVFEDGILSLYFSSGTGELAATSMNTEANKALIMSLLSTTYPIAGVEIKISGYPNYWADRSSTR